MRPIFFLFFILAAFAEVCLAEDLAWPDKGTTEIGLWTGGGHVLYGRFKDTELLIGGVRLGKMLSHVHGNSVRHNFEYVIEAVPLFVVFQQNTTTAGLDFTPLLLKWNFFTRNERPAAFMEIGAGTLFTASEVPTGTSRFNFTPQAGFGVFLFANHDRAATLELKYIHISSGGIESPNPGINSLHVLFGYNWFR